MKKRNRRKKEKSRKKLAYGIIAVAFILIFLTYISLNQANQNSQRTAIIVDHLSRREPNETFVQESRTILEEAGFDVNYDRWAELTSVNYYKSLLKQSCDLLILRVHSAITTIGEEEFVGLFTWEEYSDRVAGTKYANDVMDDRLVKAFFPEEPNVHYFGITHKFVEEYGEFQNTVIIMMGCNGLTYTSMAEAFINKGAKVYISWDKRVGADHTDQATINLLQGLIQDKLTVSQAVTETMKKVGPDLAYNNSALQYYPKTTEAGDYTIPTLKNNLIISAIPTSLRCKAPLRTNTNRKSTFES